EDWSNRDATSINGSRVDHYNLAIGGIERLASPRIAGGNTKIVYCKKQVPSLPALAYDYALISASNVCPAGSYLCARRWDNEDSGSHNAKSADIAANTTSNDTGVTWINFCFVPGQV